MSLEMSDEAKSQRTFASLRMTGQLEKESK